MIAPRSTSPPVREAFAAPSPAPTSAEPAVEPITADRPMELAIAGATNGIAITAATLITFLKPPPPPPPWGLMPIIRTSAVRWEGGRSPPKADSGKSGIPISAIERSLKRFGIRAT